MKAGQMVRHQLQGSVGVTVRLAQFPAQNAKNLKQCVGNSFGNIGSPKIVILFICCCKMEPMKI
jgi:hypothetical protein